MPVQKMPIQMHKEKKLEDLSVVELKALVYDCIAIMEANQGSIAACQQAIEEQKVKIAGINKVISEKIAKENHR